MIPSSLNPMGINRDYPLMTFEKDGNLFSSEMESGVYSSITGEKVIYATTTRSVDLIPVVPNTVYTLSRDRMAENSGKNLGVRVYSISKVYIHLDPLILSNGLNSVTFTTGADVYYIGVNNDTTDLSTLYTLNKGTVAIPYEPYNPHTYSVEGQSMQEVRSVSKNLADPNKILSGYDSLGGGVTTTKVIVSATKYKALLIKIVPNTSYTVSKQYVGDRFRAFFFTNNPIENPSEISKGGNYNDGFTILAYLTAPSDCNWLFIVLTNDDIPYPTGWVQVEQNTTVTPYQPFVPLAPSPSPQYPSPIISNYPKGVYKTNLGFYIRLYDDLRGIGEVRDKITVDVGTKEKLLTKKWGLRIIPNTTPWNGDWGTNNRVLEYVSNRKIGFNSLGLSNIATVFNNSIGGGTNSMGVYSLNNVTYWYPDIRVMGLLGNETLTEANTKLRTWLTNNLVYFTYVLLTPINQPL